MREILPGVSRGPDKPPIVVEPEPVIPPVAEVQESLVDLDSEVKSVKEILTLQEEAFSARKDMIAFRHGKKVAELTPEQRTHYAQLKEVSQTKRKVWQAELDKLPEDQQGDLKELTKLQEVRDRLATMSPEQIVTQALEGTLDSYKNELATLEAKIKTNEELLAYDKDTVRKVTALGSEEDLKNDKVRRKFLVAKIALMSTNQTSPQANPAGETTISTEPVTPTSESVAPVPSAAPTPAPESRPVTPSTTVETAPRTMLDHERAQAEAKARRLELLRESMNVLDKDILEKVALLSETSSWNVLERMKKRLEIRALINERQRLDREMNERPGFGAKFKEAASKAYKSVKSRLKFERSQHTTLDLSEAPAATTPSAEDIARVEAEAVETPAEQVEQTGSRGKWLKQRLIGLATVGWKEFRPAEKFRTGTRGVGEDLGSMSRTVESERDLSRDDAHEEANRIMAKLRAEGGTSAGDDRFMEISGEITEQRIAQNNAKIDEIVLTEMARLEEKLKGYKGDMGQDVLTEENKNKIATEMRARLVAMRSGEAEFDVKGMTTELRKGMDSKWWRRYVYAGVDAVLWGLAIKYVGGYFLSAKAKEVIATKAAAAGSKEVAQMALKDTIWGEAKRQLVSHGVSNPTNGQIQQVALEFCKDSAVKVMKGGELIWKATGGGTGVDTALARGFMIKMAGGLKTIASIKAGAIAGAL